MRYIRTYNYYIIIFDLILCAFPGICLRYFFDYHYLVVREKTDTIFLKCIELFLLFYSKHVVLSTHLNYNECFKILELVKISMINSKHIYLKQGLWTVSINLSFSEVILWMNNSTKYWIKWYCRTLLYVIQCKTLSRLCLFSYSVPWVLSSGLTVGTGNPLLTQIW